MQSHATLFRKASAGRSGVGWNLNRMARVGLEADRFTCCVRPRGRQQQLSNIRFRKGLVYYSRRQLERTKQAVQKIEPALEAAVQTQGQVQKQIAWAAVQQLRKTLDFRSWTPRGKGLVLLNLLVRARPSHNAENLVLAHPLHQVGSFLAEGAVASWQAFTSTFTQFLSLLSLLLINGILMWQQSD